MLAVAGEAYSRTLRGGKQGRKGKKERKERKERLWLKDTLEQYEIVQKTQIP